MTDDPEARHLARTYVWWQPPEKTLTDPRKLLCQILCLAWYRDGGLDEELSDEVKKVLRDAALAFRPETTAATKRSNRLD